MLNEVNLIGRLGKDIEYKQMQGGSSVANIWLATSEHVKDKHTGQTEEKTEWHSVVAWGQTADNCAKYLSKGSLVFVKGRINTRKYTNNNGQEISKTEITASLVKFLSSNQGQGQGQGHGQQQQQQQQQWPQQQMPPQQQWPQQQQNPWQPPAAPQQQWPQQQMPPQQQWPQQQQMPQAQAPAFQPPQAAQPVMQPTSPEISLSDIPF